MKIKWSSKDYKRRKPVTMLVTGRNKKTPEKKCYEISVNSHWSKNKIA